MTSRTLNEPWIVLGDYINPWGEEIRVGLPMGDLKVHASVVGTTGSGKSTLLRNLALQFASGGGTVIVIEPHGDLVLSPNDGILAALPHDALSRVAVLDFAGPSPPQLALTQKGSRSVAVATAMTAIRVVEDANWEGAVRMREILEHSLHLLISEKGHKASFLDMQTFLTDSQVRTNTLRNALDSVGESREYWERFLKELATNHRTTYEEVIQFPLRRVGGFLRNEFLRRSIALPPLAQPFDLEKLMNADEPSLILVPLQASLLGDDAKRVLGTLLMQMVSNIFMARSQLHGGERKQTLIIIDEFADLAGTEVGQLVKKLLAQARKFGASVVLATQSLTQLPRDVRQEVKSNTNVKLILRPADADDAQAAVHELGSHLLVPRDLLSIERYFGYARVVVHGNPQPPFYFRALPPLSSHKDGSQLTSNGQNLLGSPIKRRKDYRLHRLLDHLHKLVSQQETALAALDKLTKLKNEEFAEVVKAQRQKQAWEATQLLANPELEPNAVERVLRISRAKYGLPWWLLEAHYRRLRFAN